jgi:hypothetical protein
VMMNPNAHAAAPKLFFTIDLVVRVCLCRYDINKKTIFFTNYNLLYGVKKFERLF